MPVIGLHRKLRALNRLEASLRRHAKVFVTESTEFLAERSKLNAPILSGDLRKGIKPTPVTEKRKVVEGGVGIGVTDYALRMHEGVYSLGPISAAQPPTPEGGVGRKYTKRVVDFHNSRLLRELKKETDEIMKDVIR